MWSIEQPQWTCKIDEGSAGLVACYWAPNSRHILTTSNFQLRITLWSLSDKTVSYIKYPKLANGGIDFTADGKCMALAERRDCKDFVSLFDCEQWQLVRNFPVKTTDLVGLRWSPDGKVLCIWDSSLNYNIVIYNTKGVCLASYSAYENALGIKCVQWSPTGQFIAVGSFDQKVRILNHVTWKPVIDLTHQSTISKESSIIVYKEMENKFSIERGTSSITNAVASLFPSQSKFETQSLPFTVPSVKPDPEKPNPKLGIGSIKFSSDGAFIATKNDNVPNTVWVWSIVQLKLVVVLVQCSPVCDFEWDPLLSRLAICTASTKLYLWSPAGCVSVTVPIDTPFAIQRLVWHPDGLSMALVGSSHFCVCYLHDSK